MLDRLFFDVGTVKRIVGGSSRIVIGLVSIGDSESYSLCFGPFLSVLMHRPNFNELLHSSRLNTDQGV